MIDSIKEKTLAASAEVRELNGKIQQAEAELAQLRQVFQAKVVQVNTFTELLRDNGVDVEAWVQELNETTDEAPDAAPKGKTKTSRKRSAARSKATAS